MDAFLGLVKFTKGMPELGKIKLPKEFTDKLPKSLPKPIRDFFGPTETKTEEDPDRARHQRVLTLAAAARIVRDNLSNAQFVRGLLDWAMENTSALPDNTPEGHPLAERIIAAMEKETLQQNRERIGGRFTESKGKRGRPKGAETGSRNPSTRTRRRGGPGSKS